MHEQYSRGVFDVQYIQSMAQRADVLTKSFTDKTKWVHAVSLVNVHPSMLPASKTETMPSSAATAGGVAAAARTRKSNTAISEPASCGTSRAKRFGTSGVDRRREDGLESMEHRRESEGVREGRKGQDRMGSQS